MKIVHLLWSLGTGGIETMVVDIANEQSKTERTTIIVINNNVDRTVLSRISDSVRVILVNRTPGSTSLNFFVKLNYYLCKIRPDIIHCHYGTIGRVLLPGFKKVLTIHDVMCDTRYFKYYDKLFCISNAVKQYAENAGFKNNLIIYNGIHPELIKPKQVYQEEKNNYTFISIGRVDKEKGHHLIIEAFNELVNNRGRRNIRVDIIGDGSERGLLENRTHEYSLDSYIRFLGRKPRSFFYPILCNYDLFILPSTSEGFGLSIAEATCAKISVLTCDLPGPLEVLSNGLYGLSFESGNFLDLADKIENYCKNGDNQEMIEKAYSYSLQHFDVKKTAINYIEEYNSIINKCSNS